MVKPMSAGEVIAEILEENGVSKEEFANAILLPGVDMTEFLKGTTPITPDLAVRVGRYLGNGAAIWLRIDSKVQLFDNLTKALEIEIIGEIKPL